MSKKQTFFGAVFVLTLISLFPAVFYGTPFFDWDTVSYLHARNHAVRTPAYGLFVDAHAWLGGIWSLVVVQAFLLTYLLLRVFDLLGYLPNKKVSPWLFPALLIFSALPIFSSSVQMDIFFPISFLCLANYLLAERKAERYGLLVLYLISLAMHGSLLLVNIMTLALIGLIKPLRLPRSWVPLLCCLVLMVALSVMSSTTRMTRAAVFANLTLSHQIKSYVEEVCPSQEIAVCEHEIFKHELEYLEVAWGWKKNKSLEALNWGVYFRMWANAPLRLLTHYLHELWLHLAPLKEPLYLNWMPTDVAEDLVRELDKRGLSQQLRNFRYQDSPVDSLTARFQLSYPRLGVYATYFLALLFFGSLIAHRARHLSTSQKVVGLYLLFLFANAWVPALLSTSVPRYQARLHGLSFFLLWLTVMDTGLLAQARQKLSWGHWRDRPASSP